MKKYKVVWIGAKEHGPITHFFEGPSIDAAFKEAVKTHQYPEHRTIYIVWHWGLFGKHLDNPHNPNCVAPKISVVEKAKESRPQQPARTDGSVGWYDNLGKSSLSDRDILLAQLHELRTIKRCVVCTILIVIVIPIVFGVIASA